MGRYPFFVFALCGVFLPRVLSIPLETSTIDCGTMLPKDGGEPQTSFPPYVISVSSDKYDQGDKIKVTLEGTGKNSFQGFHLQARELEEDTPVGFFEITEPNTAALECFHVSNLAVGHTNLEAKNKVTTTWIAPSDTKSVQFRATVFENSGNFWAGVVSKIITPNPSQSGNVTGRRSRKKASRILIEVECIKRGGTYSSTGGCIQGGSSGSSKTSHFIGQVGVIVPGGSQGGCSGGGGYNKHACKDGAVSQNTGLTYGESVSSVIIEKPKPKPDSQPYPPERIAIPLEEKVITSCDKRSPHYNVIICRLHGGSSSSGGGTGCGQGTSSDTKPCKPQGGSSSSNSSIGCGQGTSSNSKPCNPGSQSPSNASSKACDQSSSTCKIAKVAARRDLSRALSRSSYNGQNDSSATDSNRAKVQGESFFSLNNSSRDQGSRWRENQPGENESSKGGSPEEKPNSAGKASSPGLLVLFSVLSAFAISSTVVPKWFI